MTADEKRLQVIFVPCTLIKSYENDDEATVPSIEYLRVFYLQKDYQAILRFVERTDLRQLSNRELFWASDAAYHVTNIMIVHE